MDKKLTPFIFKSLLRMCEGHSSKVMRGNTKGANVRYLGSFGSLVAGRTSQQLYPTNSHVRPSRSFIYLSAPLSARRIEYTESKTLRFTPEQMFNVVANVDQYQYFVPWCKMSRTIKKTNHVFLAELEIGFPPIGERYISEVTVVPNQKVRAVCTDGSLFSHLETVWTFVPAADGASCKVEFSVSFEFKSLLHSQLANVFFDEVVKQMVRAFESRAASLYKNQQTSSVRKRAT